MESQSSHSEVPELNMPVEGRKVDIHLPSQGGTIRVEYRISEIDVDEEPKATSDAPFIHTTAVLGARLMRLREVRPTLDLAEHVAGVKLMGVGGYSALETSLPLDIFLCRLRHYATEAYLQTASLANPCFAFHDEGHSERVAGYLEQLVNLHRPTRQLNDVEQFLVMAGAWVHDIGFAQSPQRDIHHKQAEEIIFDDSVIQAYLGNDEAAIEVVARLAFNHSSKVDVADIEDQNPTIELITGQKRRVRVRHLSCLLRLADALDIDQRRAIRNKVLLENLKSENPVSYAYHLCHQRIQSVRVDPQTCQIDIQALVRTKVDADRIRRFINQRLKLRKEVKALVPYLWGCIPDLKDELNLDIQRTNQVQRLPARFVTSEFLGSTSA